MSTLAEIKQKYSLDGAVSVAIDISAMRESANSTLSSAEEIARDNERGAFKGDEQWKARRKARIGSELKEQKRQVEFAKKMLDEVSGILDKAQNEIAKVK